jgi:hypothetical protein
MLLIVLGAMLCGCTARYSADVRNRTPQPLYVGIYQETEVGSSTLASDRLGPGDRAFVGPVRGRIGRTHLWVDTRPNPGPPVTMPLDPGMSIVEVHQTEQSNEGRLELHVVE